jgi:hypothetical protein
MTEAAAIMYVLTKFSNSNTKLSILQRKDTDSAVGGLSEYIQVVNGSHGVTSGVTVICDQQGSHYTPFHKTVPNCKAPAGAVLTPFITPGVSNSAGCAGFGTDSSTASCPQASVQGKAVVPVTPGHVVPGVLGGTHDVETMFQSMVAQIKGDLTATLQASLQESKDAQRLMTEKMQAIEAAAEEERRQRVESLAAVKADHQSDLGVFSTQMMQLMSQMQERQQQNMQANNEQLIRLFRQAPIAAAQVVVPEVTEQPQPIAAEQVVVPEVTEQPQGISVAAAAPAVVVAGQPEPVLPTGTIATITTAALPASSPRRAKTPKRKLGQRSPPAIPSQDGSVAPSTQGDATGADAAGAVDVDHAADVVCPAAPAGTRRRSRSDHTTASAAGGLEHTQSGNRLSQNNSLPAADAGDTGTPQDPDHDE